MAGSTTAHGWMRRRPPMAAPPHTVRSVVIHLWKHHFTSNIIALANSSHAWPLQLLIRAFAALAASLCSSCGKPLQLSPPRRCSDDWRSTQRHPAKCATKHRWAHAAGPLASCSSAVRHLQPRCRTPATALLADCRSGARKLQRGRSQLRR
ncbi:hypothetical protein QYE76_061217 [Lolium multiflorum]|uniref:Uncharacterized protein n=1 Tax=Lolium multiflorum TaxID=4521 RepID=A0AAD8W796_LOLMU|nr:hypothetical protein QYE76_061217 [Lolium multiflorum]